MKKYVLSLLALVTLFVAAAPAVYAQSPPAACAGGLLHTGAVSFSGDYDYHPNGSYYSSSVSGYHKGCLVGPAGTDFDLYLQKWNGSSWVIVARGETSISNETVSYFGTSGYYRWQVYSYSGSGSYNFWRLAP